MKSCLFYKEFLELTRGERRKELAHARKRLAAAIAENKRLKLINNTEAKRRGLTPQAYRKAAALEKLADLGKHLLPTPAR